MKFVVALRKELFEQWRSYRLLIVVGVLAAWGLLSPLTAKLVPEIMKLVPEGEQIAALIPTPTALDAVGQYVKNISQFAVILALLMAMGVVAQEKDKGTAALMLAKPMPRAVFLTAKFAALSLTFLAGLAVAGAGCYAYTVILFEPLDVGRWLALNGLMLLFLLVYVAVTLLCSTVSRSQVVAGGLAFGALILLSIAGAIPRVGDAFPGELLTWGTGLFAGGEPAWLAMGTSVCLIAAALLGACAIFRRQEL